MAAKLAFNVQKEGRLRARRERRAKFSTLQSRSGRRQSDAIPRGHLSIKASPSACALIPAAR